ncbi:MAG: T9SS type A sorting domain-containing protein [Chitinophagales bacterium]
MIKIYTHFLFLGILLVQCLSSFAQNEFYNNGALVTLNQGSGDAEPVLYVNGNLTNSDGLLNNSNSFLQINSGNFTNTVSTYYYQSTGKEVFSGTTDNTISGTWNGTALNRNQFYNLKVSKASATGENLILGSLTGNVANINAEGTLEFTGSNGIIRTQTTSAGSPYSGNYTNELYVRNPSASAIIGNSTGSGATTKYIEGKLRRQVNGTDTYFFPIGVAKAGLDGMEAFSIKMNSLSVSGSTTGLLGYIQPAGTPSINSDLISNGGILFYDIGYFVGSNNNFSQCVGGPDGHDDVAVINQAITHEWIVTPNVTPTSVNYNLTVYPGSNLDNITYAAMGTPCDDVYSQAKYLARDGRIGGNTAVGPTVNYWVPGVYGLYQSPTGNTISSQNGFSRFRLFGATDNNTSLPIELSSFTITPVNNEYFELNWQTASELNNAGFYLQRSTDGFNFEDIGWVAGNRTSNTINKYSFNDKNVEANIGYYYRLKQIDLDNSFNYSNVLFGKLIGNNFDILNIYPNPASINPTVTVFSPNDDIVETTIMDVLGRKIKAQSTKLIKGNNSFDLQTEDLASATYLIRFQSNNTTVTKKFVKK